MRMYFAGGLGKWESDHFDKNDFEYNRLVSLAYKSESEIKAILQLKENDNVRQSNGKNRGYKRRSGTHSNVNAGKVAVGRDDRESKSPKGQTLL